VPLVPAIVLAGDDRSDYRKPEFYGALGAGLDRAVFHRVAGATVRSLLARVAEPLTRPQDPAATGPGTGREGSAARRTAPGTP
jgi:hypothetical protein